MNRPTRTLLFAALLAVPACESDETTDPVADTSADVGAADTGTTDVGADTSADTAADTAADTSADTAVDTSADTAGDTSADTAADTSADAADDTTADASEDADATCDVATVASDALGPIDSVTEGLVEASADGDGWILEIDASAGGTAGAATSPYVYVDIANGTRVDLTDVEALDSGDWFLAFKRSVIRTNSGNSGPAGVLLTSFTETTWDEAPSPGRDAEWLSDTFVDEETCEVVTEGRDTPKTAFGIWYDYNPETHAVTPAEGVVYYMYDPRTHAVYKIAITGWDSGAFTLRVDPQ